ncbi:hypothetical protein L195_g041932, partial [Trifolium pratense]
MCKVVVELVYNDLEEYNHIVNILGGEISSLKIKRNYKNGELSLGLQTGSAEEDILNPDIVRTKGCGAMPNGTLSNQRRQRSCGVCRVIGHNMHSCPHTNTNSASGNTQSPVTEARHYIDETYEFLGQS